MSHAVPRRVLLLAVFAGGALGSLARAEVADALPVDPGRWPWATFAVNVAGAFVLGLVVTLVEQRPSLGMRARAFWGSGVCGGLTTFSTMQVELLRMLDAGRLGLASLYASVSVACGVAAVAAASRLARLERAA